MQETSLFLHSIMHIQISMDGLGIKSLGSVVWHKAVHRGCYVAIYTVNFTGYQAKLFKRNKKVLLEGKRSIIHSALSTTILDDSYAKHFKSQVIYRSCSPNWYQSSYQLQSWQNKSLWDINATGYGMVNTQYSHFSSTHFWKEKGERWKNCKNCRLVKQVGQQSALPAISKKQQLREQSFIPTHCIISPWFKIWGLHGQWTHQVARGCINT